MRERGGLTIAQDRETSVGNGMPGMVIELDARFTFCLRTGSPMLSSN